MSTRLSEEPRIGVVENFASAQECEWLISRGRDALGRAFVYDKSAEAKVLERRTNSESDFSLARADVVQSMLRRRIANTVGVPAAFFEVAKLLHYSVGQEFALHRDYLDTRNAGLLEEVNKRGQRIITFLIYLNDDFEGGETRFPKAGKSFKGRRGDAIFFANTGADGAPDPSTLHAGAPPTRGEKWLLSQWIRDKPINAFQSPPPFEALDPNWRSRL
jgi:hypothetical protein